MEHLKELRTAKKLYQKDVAAALGIDRTTYVKYENENSEPDLAMISRIAQFFGVSTDYLIGSEEAETPHKSEDGWIPVLGNVAAGIPVEAIETFDSDNPDDWEQLTPAMARNGRHIALRINGNSMEPKMSVGDVVIVRLQETIEDGEVAVVKVNGDEATCKKIKKTPEGLFLHSFNPAYEPMFYTAAQVHDLPVQILGKVVELRAKF